MKKIIFFVLFINVLVFGFTQTTNWNVNNTATWIEAINGIRRSGNNRTHIITVNGNFSIPSSDDLTFGSNAGITVTLQGNGTISLSSNGSMLLIMGEQNIIVRDLILQGRSENDSPLVKVYGGTFRMEENATVTGNRNINSEGGGVYITCALYSEGGKMHIKEGIFIMEGGKISGNTSRNGGGVYIDESSFTMQGNASISGNIAHTSGGGVCINNGTFTMQGNASVSGNTARSGWGGGGISIEKGTFVMQSNASVANNTAHGNGGGVGIENATFIIRNNASITDNTVTSRSDNLGGGGLFANVSTYIMEGGTISGNTANNGNGGGIFLHNTGTFTKTGGTIYGNNETDVKLRNSANNGRGHAVYDFVERRNDNRWRNSTSGPSSGDYGFWLNDENSATTSSVNPQPSASSTQSAQQQTASSTQTASQPATTGITSTTIPSNILLIQGGTFTMGSPSSERGSYGDERPRHQVTVRSFYMGKYEVTQKEYEEIIGTNPSYFKGENLPVERVRWFDAVIYCNRRSQREGLTPAYTISGSGNNRTVTWNRDANGYRLPTEAEWEYACRAGTTTAFNTGENASDETGWYHKNSRRRTQPVGQKPANAWGLHDMHGNVWEWCWDWSLRSYTNNAQTDPVHNEVTGYRIRRGGCWSNSDRSIRSAFRNAARPYFENSEIGFRIARNVN